MNWHELNAHAALLRDRIAQLERLDPACHGDYWYRAEYNQLSRALIAVREALQAAPRRAARDPLVLERKRRQKRQNDAFRERVYRDWSRTP